MQSPLRSQVSGWMGLAAAGALVTVLTLSGCPGTLDPTQFNSNGSGGNTGSGGSNPTGGSTGSGGGNASCTGVNDGATIVSMNCATISCHIPGPANDGESGGLDLTVDANIGSRLVGVMSVGTVDNASMCVGKGPYLNAGSNPATGLLIDKLQTSTLPCGALMPFAAPMPLSTTQRNCLIQWATTLTSP